MRPIPKVRPELVTERIQPYCDHCACNDKYGGPRSCRDSYSGRTSCGHSTCSINGTGGKPIRICNEARCDDQHYGLGLCRMHWLRVNRARQRAQRRALETSR